MKKGLITVKETAELFGISVQTIRRWTDHGKIKSIRHPINNYRLYRLVDIRKIIQQLEKI